MDDLRQDVRFGLRTLAKSQRGCSGLIILLMYTLLIGKAGFVIFANAPPLTRNNSLVQRSGYCWSYTAVLVNFLPWASVPRVVTVRLFPSSDTTILPVIVTIVPFFAVKSNS